MRRIQLSRDDRRTSPPQAASAPFQTLLYHHPVHPVSGIQVAQGGLCVKVSRSIETHRYVRAMCSGHQSALTLTDDCNGTEHELSKASLMTSCCEYC